MAPSITSMAGNGDQGFGGDGGPATASVMDNPFHVDFDPQERYLYIADCFNYRVRRVDMHNGQISTFAGNGEQGHSGDGGSATEASIDEIYARLRLESRRWPSIHRVEVSINYGS